MKIQILSGFILLSMVTLSACSSSNQPTGQSQVREVPVPNATSSIQEQQYTATQSMEIPNTSTTSTGDSSGLGSSGTGGRTGSLGSSGGSPYIPPTGGRTPANENRPATSHKPGTPKSSSNSTNEKSGGRG